MNNIIPLLLLSLAILWGCSEDNRQAGSVTDVSSGSIAVEITYNENLYKERVEVYLTTDSGTIQRGASSSGVCTFDSVASGHYSIVVGLEEGALILGRKEIGDFKVDDTITTSLSVAPIISKHFSLTSLYYDSLSPIHCRADSGIVKKNGDDFTYHFTENMEDRQLHISYKTKNSEEKEALLILQKEKDNHFTFKKDGGEEITLIEGATLFKNGTGAKSSVVTVEALSREYDFSDMNKRGTLIIEGESVDSIPVDVSVDGYYLHCKYEGEVLGGATTNLTLLIYDTLSHALQFMATETIAIPKGGEVTLPLHIKKAADLLMEQDSLALVDLSNSGTLFSTWSPAYPIGKWDGVVLSEGRVTGLNLTDRQIRKISPSFGNLTKLEECDLSYNLIDSLPSSIEKLTNLTSLNLDGNNLTSLPNEIRYLHSLTTLSLQKNQLISLPSSLSYLSLTYLHLQENLLEFDLLLSLSDYSEKSYYMPQDTLGEADSLTLQKGDAIGVNVKGDGNRYLWYEGIDFLEEIDSLVPSKSGVYTCKIINNSLIGDTLIYSPITVIMK